MKIAFAGNFTVQLLYKSNNHQNWEDHMKYSGEGCGL